MLSHSSLKVPSSAAPASSTITSSTTTSSTLPSHARLNRVFPAAAKVRRSWKWNERGGVEKSNLSMRGQLLSTPSSPSPRSSKGDLLYHTPFVPSPTSSISSASARYTPYQLPSPNSPHVYSAKSSLSSSTAADDDYEIDLTRKLQREAPYYRSIARTHYQLPISTSITAPLRSSEASGSTQWVTPLSTPVLGYSFPTRILPAPRRTMMAPPRLFGPGPFSSTRKERDELDIEAELGMETQRVRSKESSSPLLPSIRAELERDVLERDRALRDDRLEDGAEDVDSSEWSRSIFVSPEDRILPPLLLPFISRPEMRPTSPFSSGSKGTSDLAHLILSRQNQQEYIQQQQSYPPDLHTTTHPHLPDVRDAAMGAGNGGGSSASLGMATK